MAELPQSAEKTERLRVVVRCRPPSTVEEKLPCVLLDEAAAQVVVQRTDRAEQPLLFTFNGVLGADSTQEQVYRITAQPVVQSVLAGYNGTFFAYGQTGTGKTFTMDGGLEPHLRGVIPRAFDHIFDFIHSGKCNKSQFMVRVSFLEIYNEDVRDLLSSNPRSALEIREDADGSVYVKGLHAFLVKSPTEIASILQVGKRNRVVSETLMNRDSSRSHAIFSITVEQADQPQHSTDGSILEGAVRVGKLNLVDLAGSERQGATGATGERLREAALINLSLSALGNVINALVDGRTGHIPYRDSKLTRLLQDSLGGNTRTVMLACLSPAAGSLGETLSTLRYAHRAKAIRNRPRINEDPKDAMIRKFQEEIVRLHAQLASAGAAAASRVVAPLGSSESAPVKQVEHTSEDRAVAESEAQQLEAEEQGVLGPDAQLRASALIHEEAQRRAERAVAERLAAAEAAAGAAAVQSVAVAKLEAETRSERAKKEELIRQLAVLESRILRQEAQKSGRAASGPAAKAAQSETDRLRYVAEVAHANEAARKVNASLQVELEYTAGALRFQEAARLTATEQAAHERARLLEDAWQLRQQLDLKDLVLSSCVPAREVSKVLQRAHWDAERHAWSVASPINLGDTSDVKLRRQSALPNELRPTCSWARSSSASGAPRFLTENILTLERDVPARAPRRWGDPGAQEIIDALFEWQDSALRLELPEGEAAFLMARRAPWTLTNLNCFESRPQSARGRHRSVAEKQSSAWS